ncbi:amidase signature enzyme [Tilletiopsis washingtonensis]|uniref:Amidase signature enzyme n=1 Tax=Tilletiopsis washingtonensis TaxID=58919 RepID=A0A316ZCH3_9BASI|nr:amidase signature enzyme [Tilletiopsis washingtonensis]PWN99241.1 amidase signature enzyme [Tilletiopsis washingtonensis]
MSVKAHIGVQGTRSDRGILFDVLAPASVAELLRDGGDVARSVTPATLEAMRTQGPHVQTEDAAIVRALLEAGVVIIAKTTMPQTVMQVDTRSHLHGVTLNPRNLHLSPGGSSGGESALLAAGGSALGLGSDIGASDAMQARRRLTPSTGGSVRQPAACVGLYGMRPTCGRLPMRGVRSTMAGAEGIVGSLGPFAHSLRDLRLISKVLLSGTAGGPTPPWVLDPHGCPRCPWREVLQPKKLRVGVMRCDGRVRPTPPVRRAMDTAVQQLAKVASVELVDFSLGSLGSEAWDLARELYFQEGGAVVRGLIESTGEPLLPLTQAILGAPVRDHTAGEVWRLASRREAHRRAFMALWQSAELDVLLCPAAPLPAPRPGRVRYWGYTSHFNLWDMPGVVFPTATTALHTTDAHWEQELESVPCTGDADEHHRAVFDGAPVGLQLIGQRWMEEELLAAVEVVAGAAGLGAGL